MYEYHGWATLRDAHGELEPDSNLLPLIQEAFSKVADINERAQISHYNGSCFLRLDGHPNHRHAEVEVFWRALAKIAPGSYGLLYVWDDEDQSSPNEFKVFKMALGVVAMERDPFLSPCIPVIEENPN